jgi:4,5:9,10-diseco-3-hydroxy-5,9,17-trioxoandrosta-1(10),2-diene-4-oate hydrolase
MATAVTTRLEDKYVTIDGLRVRYIEQGSGPVALFLHGASLGSTADVFVDNIAQFADAGFRAVAFDIPGFGLSDTPAQQTVKAQRDSIPKFIDAAKLGKVALMAHSRSGGFAVELALAEPQRYSHVVILGSGNLLPPQDEGQAERHQAAQQRADQMMAEKEPTLEDSRKQLQADTFNHALLTDERVRVRNSRSIGQNYKNHVARQAGGERPPGAGGGAPAGAGQKPLWQRITELKMPIMLIYGREDRAHAAERAEMLKKQHPEMNVHIIPNCKHLVPWDAADEVLRLSVPFLKS